MKQIVDFEQAKKLFAHCIYFKLCRFIDRNGNQTGYFQAYDPEKFVFTIGEYYPAPAIGELIEWIDAHTNNFVWTGQDSLKKNEWGAGILDNDAEDKICIYKPELIGALVELAIKIAQSANSRKERE
jgi:hypothetical protein